MYINGIVKIRTNMVHKTLTKICICVLNFIVYFLCFLIFSKSLKYGICILYYPYDENNFSEYHSVPKNQYSTTAIKIKLKTEFSGKV